MGACLSSFFKFSRLLVTGLICISAAVSLPSPAGAEDISARFLADYGNVTVMEVTGNFDENTADGAPNVAPRQAVAREFFRTHKDDYDFVTIFTNFDFNMRSDAVAFYSHVKNDVRGIGKQIYDNSTLYGSNGKLQGTIDMGNLLKLATDNLNPKFDFTVDTMVHEMLHRWSAYVKFKDWNGTVSDALLGQDKAHWSFLLDSSGSTMYGNKWQNNGDGTFTSIAVRKYYSPLDLYLMGMIDKSKVPPTLLIENPAIAPSSMPELGSTISGTARYVNIDDIIAVEGERTPPAGDSQKQFRMAFIYVVAPGTFKADDLPGIENVRNGYLTRYSILTDGKGLVQVTSTPREELPANPGVHPPATLPRTLPPNINDGLTWLVNHQQSDGSWTDFALTTERDTAESVATLQIFPTAQNQFQAGLNWLGTNASNTTDYLTRGIEARVHAGGDSSSLVQELLSRRNSDGGWGGGRNFVSSPTDTALALKSLAAAGYNDRSVVGQAVAYLQATQNPDGGWSGDNSASIIQPTAAVLSAYNSYGKMFDLEAGIGKGVAFLTTKQNPDGGFGNSPSTVYDSSLALMALQAVNGDRISIGSGISYLLNQQSQDGSWNESPFQTALAMRAVWQATVDPDLSVKAEDVSIIPATITALPTNAVLSATIRNLGRSDVSQARVALYEGSIAPDHILAEQTLAFPGQSAVTVTFSIPVTSASGHVYHVVVDPDSQLAESNKNNNSAAKTLLPEITYDFQIQASDITIAPNPADIGKDVKISLKVANRGTSDAYSVPVRIFIDQPGAPLEIARMSTDIQAGGVISREVNWRAGLAGANLPLTVQIDPDSNFTETNKDNNSASVPLTLNASTLPNLSVSYRDMLITPSPAREGGSASISVLVKNNGFSTAGNVNVTVYKGVASNGGAILGSQVIPSIPAGQSVRTAIEWSGIAENGERIISVQVDPDNAIQEIAEDDNFTFTTVRILGLPDVAVTSDSVTVSPSAPREGEPVAVTVTVSNLGDQDTANVDLLLKEGDAVIGSQTIPILAGNSQVILNIPFTPIGSGVHQLTAIVDPGNHVIERGKQNNVASKLFTVQNARFWLSERYISPNGDGNRDNTQLFFRPDTPTSITIEISDALGKVVKNFGGGDLDNTSGTTVTWDGKDNNGSVVRDGTYGIVIYGDSLRVLARENIVVDTNRLPLSGALSANSLIERNIACHLPLERNRNTIAWLPDESGLLVHLLETVPQTPEYPAGIYILSPNGDTVTPVLPDRWSDDLYTYSLDSDSVKVARDGKTLTFIVWRGDRTTGRGAYGVWLGDLSGGSRRLVHQENENLTIYDTELSPDGKKILYSYGPVYREGWAHHELAYVGVEQGDKNTIVYGYPLGYSGLIGTAWSPDSTRIAFVQNLFCNSEGKSCNQENERLMVYDLNGSTSTWKVNNSSRYSFDLISWIDSRSLFYDYDSNGNIELIRDGEATSIVTDAKEYVISPQGDKVAFVDNEINNGNWISSNLKIVDSEGLVTVLHKVVKPPQHGYEISPQIFNLIWSPDGRKITFVEGLDGVLCEYYGKLCPEAYGPNLMTVDLASGSKGSSPLAWPWSYSGFHLNLLDWLDNGSVLLAQDSTYGSNNPLLAIGVQNASSTPLVQGVSLPGEEELLLSPGKNYLTYDSYGTTRSVDGLCRSSLWSSTSVANLTAELQAVKGKQSVLLKGVATDLNFESYAIEYAATDTPDVWSPIVSVSTKPVINDTFATWLPPSIGAYLVRLSVRDLAGNATSRTVRLAWGTSLPLNSVLKSTDIISPNGDGVQDSVTLDYSVSEPVHLDFTISNESGTVVRTISVEHPAPQRSAIVWDGRDEAGIVVPDGKYSIKVFDYEFFETVDFTLPDAGITLNQITARAFKDGDYYYKDFMASLTGHARDINFKQWRVLYGEGENPQEWSELFHDSTQLSETDDNGKLVDKQIAAYGVSLRSDGPIFRILSNNLDLLVGKSFRIDGEDFAGNKKTVISGRLEETIGLILWDDQLISFFENDMKEYIPARLMEPGLHHLKALETVRNPFTQLNLQYSVNDPDTNKEIWYDDPSSGVSESGIISIEWDRSKISAHISALRIRGVDSYGVEYFSKRYPAEEEFYVEKVKCDEYVNNHPYTYNSTKVLELQIQSNQDSRYADWTTVKIYDATRGEKVEGDRIPLEVNPSQIIDGKTYHVRVVRTPYAGLPKISSKVIHGCQPSTSYKLMVRYPEGDCGATQKKAELYLEKTDKNYFLNVKKAELYMQKPEGYQLIQSMSDDSISVTIDTTVLAEGNYPVRAFVTYFNVENGVEKNVEVNNILVVDRVSPIARITYPADSSLVLCPVQTNEPEGPWFAIQPEGVAKDNTGVKTYELFYGEGNNPAAWLPAETIMRDKFGLVSKQIVGAGTLQGTIGKWNITDKRGDLNYVLKLKVTDIAGNVSCATSEPIFFDKAVDIPVMKQDIPLFSPNGNGTFDNVNVSYGIDEYAKVDVKVFKLIENPNTPPILDAIPVRTILSGQTHLSGTEYTNWDGRGDTGSVLTDGRYGIAVFATDACGNSNRKWIPVEVDNAPPSVDISFPRPADPLPPGIMLEIKGTATDSHFKSYLLEAGEGDAPSTWKTLATSDKPVTNAVITPWNTFGLKDRWTLRLSSEDSVGNRNVTATTIDLGIRKELVKNLSATPKLFSPNSDQKLDAATISYEVTDACNVKIDLLDGSGQSVKTFTAVSSGADRNNIIWEGKNSLGSTVPDGIYTVRLSVSLASNPQITQTETLSLVIDNTPPALVVTEPAEKSFLNRTDITVVGSINDPNLADYNISMAGPSGTTSLDSGAQNRLDHSFGRIADLSEDTYTVTVDAGDLGENRTRLVRTFTIDRTPPKVTLSSPKTGEFYGNSNNSIAISGVVDEKNLERYSLRYGPGDAPTEWTEILAGTSLPSGSIASSLKVGKADGIADGLYTISLYARDKAGLEAEAKSRVVVDNTTPVVSLAYPKEGDYITRAMDIKGTAADSYFDKGSLDLAEGPCATAAKWAVFKNISATVSDGVLDSWKLLPADGEYCLRISATDKSGNKSEARVGFRIDTHPPTAPRLTGQTENKTANSLNWTRSPETDLGGYNVYRNGQKLNAAPLSELAYPDSGLKEGTYTYFVKAVDFAGNESDASNVVTLKVDLNGPTVRISSPAGGARISGLTDIKGTAYSQDDFKEYRVSVGQGSSPGSWTVIRRSPLPISFGTLAQLDSLGSLEGAQLSIKLEGEDISGNVSSAQTTVTVDNTAPQTPLLLSAMPGGADVALSWKANTDTDLAGYLLYRNDQLANVTGIVAGSMKPYLVTGTNYTDKALPDGTYRYYLVAMDQAENSSDQSNVLEVSIDTHPPHMTISEPASGLRFDTKATIKAESPDNDIATVQFKYKRPQDTDWTNLGAPLAKAPFMVYFDPKSMNLAYGDYQLQVLALDKGGKPDPAPPVVTLTYTDLTPPDAPASPTAKVNGADVTLTWGPGIEADLDGYNVYRWNNGSKTRLNVAIVKNPVYPDVGVPDGNYGYEITAIDIHGNESKPSARVAARIYAPLVAQPYTPLRTAALTLEGSGVTPNSIVEMTMVTSSGATTKTTISADSSGLFRLEGITAALGENTFTAMVIDGEGNISRSSEPVVVSFDEPPAAPTGLAASVDGYDVSLTWDDTGEPDIIGYNLFRDGEKLNNSVAVTGGSASASYQDYYSVPQSAMDGNYSTYWSTRYGYGTFTPAWWQMALQTPELINKVDISWRGEWDSANNRYNILAGRDYEVQGWSGHNWVTLKQVVGNEQQYNTFDVSPSYRTDKIRIAITSSTDRNPSKYARIDEIRFQKDNLLVSPGYSDQGLPDKRYSYQVTAIDRYGFESPPSSPAVAAVGDVEPPGPPLALSATVQGSDVVLTWSPPQPAADDLAEYYVYRETPSGRILVGVVSPSAPTYNDRNLANNSYRYRVTARDFKGNESAFSNEASATVQVELPASPPMLSVSAPARGSALDLSWQPPAGSGRYSYNVYRSLNESGTFIRVNTSAISDTKYHDNGLDNGISYYYRVKALDSIGNEGEASNTASAVPRDTVTVQPVILKPTVAGTPFVTREYGLTVGGFAEPAALVDIISDDALVGSATALIQERQTDLAMAMDTYAVSLSPDGKLLASNINSQDLTLLDMSSNITTNVSSGLSYIWGDLQWSPSGRYLLITGYDSDGQSRITLYDRETGSMRIAATGDTLNEFSPSWSSGSDNYVFAGTNPNGRTSMWIAGPGDGSVIRIADVNFADLPRLSPDGTRVAYFDNGVLSVFDRTNSTTTLIDDNNDQWSSSWSPDGSSIAFVSYRDGDGDIYSYNVTDGSVERRTTSKQGGYRVVWSPDGLQLGYVTYSGSDELLMVVDANGAEKRVFSASGEIYGIPEWRPNGELIIFDQLGLHTVQPPGYFSARVDRLVPGENHLVAISTDASGNRSTPSESISVVLDTGIMPDLAIAESDISLFPPYPKPGEEVLLTARVRNTSNNPVGNVAVDLYLWDGTGDVALIKSESIPGIVANGDGAVSARFVAGTDIGTGTIIAVVDPANLIQEVVETNNHAAKDLIVTDQERVSISSSTSSSQFGANQEASFEVTLMNSGSPTSGTLKVMIEDSNGNIVRLITSQPQDLPYALNQKLAFSWNTGATYAGSYRLHVLVTDEIGTVTLAESATPFSILPDIKASGSVTTDKQSYGPGETVVVNVSFINSGVNHVMPQLKVRLQIVDSVNTRLFNEEKSFTSLLPALGGSFSSSWNTGSLPAGAYAAVVDLSADGQLLESRTTVFNILPQPLLKGTLTTDTATVLSGRGFTAGYTLSNHGNSTATGIVRITLQDPDGQTIVASSEQPAAIQVNGSMPGSVTFDTTGLTPRTYQVVLSFKSDATWQNLAMATIAVRDGLPPTITIVSPLEAASYTADVSLSVFASDDFSGVAKVEYSIDNGAWKPLPLADAFRGRHSSSWTPALTDNGSHSVSFRGIDRAGNISHPVSVNFDVLNDTTAPVLVVSTLANESYTNNEVLNISGTVSDNVAVKELLINGASVPFNPDGSFSHALILADGGNTIEVTATDSASNPASDIRTIHLDQKAPLIDITTPADNSKTNNPEIIVSGNVDETSTVEVLLNGVAQPSERQTEAFKASLAAVYGPNTIEVIAVDQAMNKGTEKRTVTFDDRKPSLAITEPGQDIRTNRDVLILKGTVADTLTSVSVSIEMDGTIYTPAVTDGGFEQRLVMTEEKSYLLKVTATDEAGNSISVPRNVIYDITPPVLTIAAVVSPTVDDSQVISGTREADSEVVVTSSTATIGTVTYPSETTWQVSVTALKPGSNIVTASSTDGADNVATISKEIVYTVSTSSNIFSAAIFGNSGVTMAGNSYTDSYINSPSSWIRGKYKNGDIATNSLQPCGIKMSGGTQVFGKLWVGQDGNPATVGCINGGASVSGGSGALAVAKDMTPKTDPAGGISIGAIKLSGHGSKTLAAGDYRVSTININGNSTLNLSGPITLHVDGNFSLSGNSSIVITSGEVTIYQNGQKLQISGGSIVNTNRTPASLVIYGTAGLQTVNISGNTDLHALVYAPTAAIKLSGGQNTFGSIIGNTVDISGGSSVHYDEGLKD